MGRPGEVEMATFEQIISKARRESGLSAAEFDFSLAQRGGALDAIGNAQDALLIASGVSYLDVDAFRAAREEIWPAVEQAIAAAAARRYTGWDRASQALGLRVAYAH